MAVDKIIRDYGTKDLDEREHFRLGKLECYELAKVRSTRHARYNINYHSYGYQRQGQKFFKDQ